MASYGDMTQAVRMVASASDRPAAAIAAYRAQIPTVIRAALEKTFTYWHENFGPKHFKRSAFQDYPNTYEKNYKKDFQRNKTSERKSWRTLFWQIRKGKNTDKPFVKTGDMKDAFLYGSYNFTGSNENLKINWKGLPKYAYMYYPGKFNKQLAIVDWNDSEKSQLELVFNMFLTDEINKLETTGTATSKSYGRAIL
jgi:hypothetical protein